MLLLTYRERIANIRYIFYRLVIKLISRARKIYRKNRKNKRKTVRLVGASEIVTKPNDSRKFERETRFLIFAK